MANHNTHNGQPQTRQPRRKKRTGLKLLLGASALGTVLYFGNAYGIKDKINTGINQVEEIATDIFTDDIYSTSEKYSNQLSELTPEEQINSLDEIISKSSEPVQQILAYQTFQRQSPEYQGAFIEDAISNVSNEYKVEIGKHIIEGAYLDGKERMGEFFSELGDELIELYDIFIGY